MAQRRIIAIPRCIECNHEVWVTVKSCPACLTTDPFGIDCSLCTRRFRRLEGVYCERLCHTSDWQDSRTFTGGFWAHKDCVERYFTVPPTLGCPGCGLLLLEIDADLSPVALWTDWKEIHCPRCGTGDLLKWHGQGVQRSACTKCHAPLYAFQREPDGRAVPNARGHGHPTIPAPATAPSGSGCSTALAAVIAFTFLASLGVYFLYGV